MKTVNIAISKEQMSAMPLVTFPGKITIVDTPELAAAALGQLSHAPVVGFDTETKPSFKKGQVNSVALVQISTLDHCYLFRVNKPGVLQQLRGFMQSDAVAKIGLSLKDDFNVLRRNGDFSPAGFVDLQQLVREYGIADSSLQKIYAIIFGERISKGQRLSNWEAATLTPSQCSYASIDAWACLRIYNTLTSGQFHPALSPYITPNQTQQQ